jgi:osmotically-inducible protein OsmY
MVGVGAPIFQGPSTYVWAADNGSSDAQVTSEIQKQLKGKNYRDVTVHADNGTVMLSGQVDLYGYKLQAVKKAKKVRGVQDVQDNIAVGGPSVPDNELERKLMQKIEVDRVGFGQAFDAIGARVQNGVVTLEGHAVGPVAANSAVALTEYMPGVKGVVNHIQVDPLSPMDNGIRIRAFRAIYGFPALRRYASIPSRPIRISVQNGNITLYGVVDNNMDKQLAYTRAMQVQGVFHVTNDLMVANGNGK